VPDARRLGLKPGVELVVRTCGLSDYVDTWRRMRRFTETRDDASRDELWLLEHPRIFTFGQAGRHEHLLDAGGIPVVDSDRGGQVTYHGPGQLIAYVLMDLRRRRLGVRRLVEGLEQCVIDLLAAEDVTGERRERAPGVYVSGKKICALGLRIRNGCSYHGLALNVDMDLEPFRRIEPCGFAGLEATQTRELGIPWDVAQAGRELVEAFTRQFAYRAHRDLETSA
jgi:lipoyl(octanoyl) transferase